MTTPATATVPGTLHVDDLWGGGPVELRRTLEHAGITFEPAPEGGLLFACPVTGEHEVHATLGDHADHVELRCLGGCPEDSVRALLRLAAADPLAPLAGERRENGHFAEAEAPALRFLSPAEVREMVPPEPPWVWDGFIAPGNITLMAGRPKGGKSTLTLGGLVDAVTSGADAFLGRKVRGGPVVYVSEEDSSTLRHKLPDDDVPLRVLPREAAWPKPDWPTLVEATVAEAERVDAALVVIDTFSFWGALPPEREQDAGAVQHAMRPLVEAAARSGLAILVIHHARKGGGEDGEAVRGSSAFAGAVDVVLELQRPDDEAPSNQRALLALSRYPQTPGVLLYDYEPRTGAWGVIGEAEERGASQATRKRAAVLGALGDETLTQDDFKERIGDSKEWRASLKELVHEGIVEESGEGKKGDPYTYRRILWEGSEQNSTETRADSGAFRVGAPKGPHGNPESVPASLESGGEPVAPQSSPRVGDVYEDPEVPDVRLRVVSVECEWISVESEAQGGSGMRERVPLSAFAAGQLRSVDP